MIKKQLATEFSFEEFYSKHHDDDEIIMNWKKNHKKKDNKNKQINNLVNSTDGLNKLGTISTSVILSLTGVGIIVVPIAAGAICATGIPVKHCSSWLKKKGAKL